MSIYCEACGMTLRQDAGVHRAGEPMAQRHGNARLIPCPGCGHMQTYEDGTDGGQPGSVDPGT